MEFLAQLRSGQTKSAPPAETPPPPAAAAPTATAAPINVFEEAESRPETLDAFVEADAPAAPEYVESGRCGVVKTKRGETPDVVRGNKQLEELFNRVNVLLGDNGEIEDGFKPKVPQTIDDTGLTEEEIERIVFKFLLQRGSASGRELSAFVRLPYGLLEPLLKQWKKEQLVAFKGTAEMGDYVFLITDTGRERGRRYMDECSYVGAAPVGLADYLRAMEQQSMAGQSATEDDVKKAFYDLLVAEEMLEKLGPAINSGRGMFLFGEAGNGKTSIAERITRCFGDKIWIPRTLGIDGEIIRVFDPGLHEEVPLAEGDGLFDLSGIDQRWVRITRPTVVAGGELTMAELEVTQNPQTKICEAPLQLKSNCGTLVIDDFGRQSMPVDVLLNRWIVPLEKRYDYLNLPSGKKIQVPFDQLIIFSTNLEPKNLVDGAFLRRIPYKIQVPDPSREHFTKLFDIMAPKLGLILEAGVVDYLIETHYLPIKRPFRNCQPRDLLLQVRNWCVFKKQPKRVTNTSFDFAVANYFSMM